ELYQRVLDGHRADVPRVIVVKKDREQPHVVARGFDFLIGERPDLAQRLVTGTLAAVGSNQLELLDLLELVVLEYLKVLVREVAGRLTLLVGDDHVDADEVDAGLEDGLIRLWLRRGLLRLRLWLSLLRRLGLLLLRAACLDERHDEHDERRPTSA